MITKQGSYMSKIEWTDKTWNVITGCTQTSPACQNCYAKAMTRRLKAMKLKKYASGWDKIVFHEDILNEILTKKYPQGIKIFVNSMSDTFHEDISDHKIKKLFIMMNQRVDLTFQVLTKRAKRMFEFISTNKDIVTPNIQLGVTAENQEMFNQRVKYLTPLKEMQITTFVSCEPLLESIDISEYIDSIDWVIVGGEKAHKKGRIMEYEWVKDIYAQCQKTQTPFFFKQWGDCEKKIKLSMQGIDNELLYKIENTKEFPKN